MTLIRRSESLVRSRRRATTSAAVLTTGALALAGCANGGASGAESPSFPTGQTITVTLIAPGPSEAPADKYLKATFEQNFPGNTLVFKDEAWATRTADYKKELIDGKGQIPDIVEIGNTDTPAYTSTGALVDLTDQYEDLGGKDLLQSFVDLGTYNGKFYAPPFYGAAHVVFESPQASKLPEPTTLDQFVSQAKQLTKGGVSGDYLPGQDWYDAMPFVWENGGYIAKQVDGKWKAGFATTGGIAGLTEVQTIFTKATDWKVTPKTMGMGHEVPPFCASKVAYILDDTSFTGRVAAPATTPKTPGCPDGQGKYLTAFALPGVAAGSVAKTFAGGSNLAIPSRSTHHVLAYQALKIMESAGYQDLLAIQGLIPARISAAQYLPQNTIALQSAKAAQNSVATPVSPKWSDVENEQVMEKAFQKIAEGQDVTTVAKNLDTKIESVLNG